MDLVKELERIIHRHPSNTTAALNAIPLDELLTHHEQSNSSNDSRTLMVKSIPELVFLIVSYTLIIVIAVFGNIAVCQVIYRHKRLHTVTNVFISNLSVSDVFIAVLNIPFNLARNVTDEWQFGWFMCGMVNFILMVAVYVSTFTMAAISLDRYLVIIYPLRPRMTMKMGISVLLSTWVIGALMSLPFLIYAKVETVDMFLYSARRCRLVYPHPADKYEQGITLATVIAQYVLPMSIIAVAYGRISRKLWIRPMIGQPNATQHLSQGKMKQKTIKMLIVIVVIFCLCWTPLNLYHLLTDLHPDSELFLYNSTVYLICHWLAMSSVCYNPFIYLWFNDYFRSHIRSWFSCFYRRSTRVHPGLELDGILIRLDRVGVNRRCSPVCSTNGGMAKTMLGSSKRSTINKGGGSAKNFSTSGFGGRKATVVHKQSATSCIFSAANTTAGGGGGGGGVGRVHNEDPVANGSNITSCTSIHNGVRSLNTSHSGGGSHCGDDRESAETGVPCCVDIVDCDDPVRERSLTEHYFKTHSGHEKEF